MELKFERETCSRCGGSGKHSYCESYGDTCFKCHGKGVTLTKRGHAAALWMIAQRTIAAKDVKVGMRAKYEGIGKAFYFTVTYVGFESGAKYQDKATGEFVPYLAITGKEAGINTFPDATVEIGPNTKEEKIAQLTAAIEYQNTLTKAGKVSARSKATAEGN